MKRTLSVFLVVAIVSMFLVAPVAAATSQGLEWGAAYGHKVEYEMSSIHDEAFNEDIYINVTAVPTAAIPDPLTDWSNIPDFTLKFWWANGTSMGIISLVFLGVFFIGGKFVVPLGNWTLLEELLAPEISGEEFSLDANLWRIVWSEDFTTTEEYEITGAYSKVDGFLSEYKLKTVSTLNDTVLESFEVIRKDIPTGDGFGDIIQLLQDNILYVGAGVAVILIIGIIACKRR
jgi:hypothetical protein